MSLDSTVLSIGILVLTLLTVLNFIMLVINTMKVKKYKKYYEKTLAKFNSHENIKDEFQSIYDRLNEVEKVSKDTTETVNIYIDKLKSNISKIGLVKYNAYDETENKLSFALAMLNENKTGILLNHIYSKHGSSIYAKLVTEGKVEERISEEEATALKSAIEDKEYKERKEEVVSKNKKQMKKSKQK